VCAGKQPLAASMSASPISRVAAKFAGEKREGAGAGGFSSAEELLLVAVELDPRAPPDLCRYKY
jgi:hypothetical protein